MAELQVRLQYDLFNDDQREVFPVAAKRAYKIKNHQLDFDAGVSPEDIVFDRTRQTLVVMGIKSKEMRKNFKRWFGYTLQELVVHVERQFLPGMCWGNRRRWDLDHIVPKCHFRITSMRDPNFRFMMGLSNIRPLWSSDNGKKTWHRTHLL